MPYAPQRRHAVGLISNSTQALNLIQHLYQPNLLILVARMLAQMQINAAGLIHPNRSLLSLCLMLTLMNATAGLLHLLDHMGGPGKGLMLDFVGQANPPSLTRIILLDLLIYMLQIHSLSISYLNNKAASTFASVPALPFADMLLPVSAVPEEIAAEDFDVESGLRRRKGKRRAGEEDEEVVWLDEEDDEGDVETRPSERDRLLTRANPAGQKVSREPPRIISLPLPHLLNLILHMPSPSPAPHLFAGASPAVLSPHGTSAPALVIPDLDLSASASVRRETLFSPSDGEEEEETEEQEHESARRSIVRSLPGVVGIGAGAGAERDQDEEDRRVPGQYWVGGRGNGG